MRSTGDLLRRRNYLVRKRAELISHIQISNSQYNHEPFGRYDIIRKCCREEALSNFTNPGVALSVRINFNIIDSLGKQVWALEQHVLENARNHDPHSYHLLRTVHGIGKILALCILYEIGDINRFPGVQQFASYCRLVKCSRESPVTGSFSGSVVPLIQLANPVCECMKKTSG